MRKSKTLLKHLRTNLYQLLTCQTSVSSVYFPNVSNFNVANIQGSPAYKHLMHTMDVKNDHDYIAPVIDIQASLGLQSLHGYLRLGWVVIALKNLVHEC